MVGVGFHPHRRDVEGRPLPNLEHPRRRIQRPTDQAPPVGFGPLAPTWEPRTTYAGTYDARWQEEDSPYLPADFDSRFFQVAPEDQRFPRFKGGELLRCFAMAAEPIVQYILPVVDLPVTFSFAHRAMKANARSLHVLAAGMACPVGLYWKAAGAAMRAGIDRKRELPFLDGGGNPVVGHESAAPVSSPSLAALSDIRALSAAGDEGASAACALAETGALWCWGDGAFGQLGAKSPADFFEAVPIAGLPFLDQVAVGGAFVCGKTTTGQVYCWGSNRNGTAPDGARGIERTPVIDRWPGT
jgi:hypothetical protein